MSRTFRRKGYEETQGSSWDRQFDKIAGYYTVKDWKYNDNGYWYVGRLPTEKELYDKFKRAHGESKGPNAISPGREYRHPRMKQNRSITRQELHRFVYREDYEPMVEADPRNCWWDWS